MVRAHGLRALRTGAALALGLVMSACLSDRGDVHPAPPGAEAPDVPAPVPPPATPVDAPPVADNTPAAPVDATPTAQDPAGTPANSGTADSAAVSATPPTHGDAAATATADTPPPDAAPPADPVSLPKLVKDLAIVHGRWLGCASAQTVATARWAGPDFDACAKVRRVNVISRAGVERRTVRVGEHAATIGRSPDTKHAGFLGLASRRVKPHPDARVEDRWLSPPGPDKDAIVAWVREKKRRRVIPVGELRGDFGGDNIDRIFVLRPRRMPTVDDSERAWTRGELAVLLSGETPKGFLPFDHSYRVDGEWTRESVAGLQVGGVVDLDGDGVEEVIWVLQPLIPMLLTEVRLSYFDRDRGKFRIRELWACSYCGSNMALPKGHTRGMVKDKNGGRSSY